LLTLSDRFIIALSTKPPRPFVGDGGRAEEDKMLEVLPRPGVSAANEVFGSKGLNVGKSRAGGFEGDDDIMETGRGLVWSELDGCRGLMGNAWAAFGGDGGGVAFSVSSFERSSAALDMPGSRMARLAAVDIVSESISFLR
jgi:hypothetical protein